MPTRDRRSEAIEKATKEFEQRDMKRTEGNGFANRESAEKKLKEFCDHGLASAVVTCEMNAGERLNE